MFSRLLVGLDGSAGAAAALDAAITLGKRFHSTIVLAAVVDQALLEAPLLGGADGLWTAGLSLPAGLGEASEAMRRRAAELLAAAAARVADADLALEEASVTGHVDEELLRLADRAEAIVVGRRGEMHEAPGTIGATTARIVKRAQGPVVVAGEAPSAFERVLVAFDGGETSTAALTLAARYAEATLLPIDVVHVNAAAAAGERLLGKAVAFLAGTTAHYATRRLDGEVAPAIAAYVAGSRADVLLVGAHGGRRRSWSTGSHAEQLVRTTSIPVIVVR